jgi:beta-glucosidase
MSATGIRWDYGPVLAVPQDVRWGRTYEGYGEDPALVARLGAAFIVGLQGPDLSSDDAAAATAKHFVGDGGTAWGSSTTEGYVIDQGVTDVDDETLRAIHLAPYEEAIAAGARTVMASFSSTGAGKVHGDRRLLTDILKGELGFTGFVVSDWAGVDQVAPGDYDAPVARSISAGIDMVMVPYDTELFQRAVRTGLEEGAIAQDRIDDAVARILRVKFEMGLFEQPMPTAGRGDLLGSPEHRELGRRAVAGSLVLLQSDADVLPLGDEASLLVAGTGADDIGLQSGGWTIEWQGATGDITLGTTLVEALSERIGTDVRYDRDAAFPEGTSADVGIVVVAEPPYAEGLGDSATLALPPADVALVGAMRDRVDRLIVVIYSGRPVMLDGIVEDADAIVAAWLPGTEAAGIADVLFGEVPFRGTTPFTWPVTPGDAPRTGRDPCDGAIFPLGYGLDASGERLGVEPCSVP